jgi:HAMP domain-containing protein
LGERAIRAAQPPGCAIGELICQPPAKGGGRALVLAVLLTSLLIAWFIGRSIAEPVQNMARAMTGLADGRLETSIPHLDARNEIGAMAHAVQVFKENAIAIREAAQERDALARRAEAEKAEAMRSLADAFATSVGGIVAGVSTAAKTMQSSAHA